MPSPFSCPGVALSAPTVGTPALVAAPVSGGPGLPEDALAAAVAPVLCVDLAGRLGGDGDLDAAAYDTGTHMGRAASFPDDGAGRFGEAHTLAAADRVRDVRGAAVADFPGPGALDQAAAAPAGDGRAFTDDGTDEVEPPMVTEPPLAGALGVAPGDTDRRVDVAAVALGGAQAANVPGDGARVLGPAVVLDGSATDAVAVDARTVDAPTVDAHAVDARLLTLSARR